jgi:hypothetical protein
LSPSLTKISLITPETLALTLTKFIAFRVPEIESVFFKFTGETVYSSDRKNSLISNLFWVVKFFGITSFLKYLVFSIDARKIN